eukprot:204835-Chlamydomonas_euryale.AAC.1
MQGKDGPAHGGSGGALGTDAEPDRGQGVRRDGGAPRGTAERGAPASGAGQPARAQRVRVRGQGWARRHLKK